MKFATLLLMAGLLAGSATTAFAGLGKGACAGDVATLCKDEKPGGGRIVACLKAHEASVSAACKEHLAEVKGAMNGAQRACQDDVERFCPEVKPGKGRIFDCLHQHQANLSGECQEKLGLARPK